MWKIFVQNRTRSYGHMTFNQSAQSNIEISDHLVFQFFSDKTHTSQIKMLYFYCATLIWQRVIWNKYLAPVMVENVIWHFLACTVYVLFTHSLLCWAWCIKLGWSLLCGRHMVLTYSQFLMLSLSTIQIPKKKEFLDTLLNKYLFS